MELLTLLGKFDSTAAKKLADGSGNAKYVHHDIQGEFTAIMANMLWEQVSNELNMAEHFALIVDETRGIRKKKRKSLLLCVT